MNKKYKLILLMFSFMFLNIKILIAKDINTKNNKLDNENIYQSYKNLYINIEEDKDITEKYIKENFLYFKYDYNKNKDIEFSLYMKKDWDFNEESITTINPFDYKDKETLLLTLIDFSEISKNQPLNEKDLYGAVFVYVSSFEMNSGDMWALIIKKLLKQGTIVYSKAKKQQNGIDINFVGFNRNGNIIRGSTLKNGNIYYMYVIVAKNENIYKKNIKDINISVESFKLNSKKLKISAINLKKEKIIKPFSFSFIYPSDSKIENNYKKNNKYANLSVITKNNIPYNIIIIPKKYYNQEELAKYFLSIIEKQGLKIEKIDKNNFIVADNKNVLFKLKSEFNGKKYEIYGKSLEKDNNIILVATTNILKLENELLYFQTRRILDIILYSINFD